MKLIRNFITNTDTTNATNIPITKTSDSVLVKEIPKFSILIALKPNITGTARKNVNSAAATLDTPIISAPMIVAHGDVSTDNNIAQIKATEIAKPVEGIKIKYGEFTVEFSIGCDAQSMLDILRLVKEV